MIELVRGAGVARILPEEGAVAVSLRIRGREVLCTGPAAREPERTRPLARDEEQWVRAWRGGWQLCFPTTGQPDPADPAQGFHGSASQAEWTVVTRDQESVELSWQGDGLQARRRWSVHDDGLSVVTSARNVSPHPRPVAIAEHLVLGGAVLDAPLQITPDDGAALTPLDYAGTPCGDPTAWPGDPADRWTQLDADTPARVAALRMAPSAGRRVRLTSPQLAASVEWEGEEFAHALLWEELGRTTEPPWEGAVRALGVEPTTTGHGAGTGHGEGIVAMAPGARLDWSCRLRLSWIGASG